ncbi:SixA phosphatase family protein [Algibacter mikhailovii]|uniref:SixA phosphatase family protein n=1 Tax=Algibacter mikhailovii TaxID=425498 RepID=UPI0024940B72|nr:phosphoglycerate mutase family protein [Algibacter mikhailovii]
MTQKIALILSFFILTCCFESKNSSHSTTGIVSNYYFIRHAEKDRSNPSEPNPHLTKKGLDRANTWSAILSQVPLDLVYSTNYHRTIETAKPAAIKNNKEISIYDPNTINYDTFLKHTNGKNTLIVGHSNTIPKIVNAITKNTNYETIKGTNNGNLYLVSIIDGRISSQLLKFN